MQICDRCGEVEEVWGERIEDVVAMRKEEEIHFSGSIYYLAPVVAQQPLYARPEWR